MNEPGIKRWRAEVASDDVFALGEGPLWDAPRRRVLWVDILAGTVHGGLLTGDRVERTESHTVDRYAGAVVCSAAGDLLVAGEHALWVVTASGEIRPGPAILPPGSERRLNDGACDPDGRFLVGSLALGGATGGEVLVRVEPGGDVTVLDDDLALSNGLAWSPDGGTLYSIDTVPGIVWARPYGDAPGSRRELFRVGDGGSPDGMCVDTEGTLWIACWGAGQVRRYTDSGELIGVVDVDAPHTSSAAFVGPLLDRLVITTADGTLFVADVGVIGLPPTPWAGP
ncbi:SMP-30/gluconolactonase/LRE family protein [Micromonospora sp. CPCC 205371]|nr:SMP-30/gluconolactonase/LRE family protein [Micromonospora sp. CPCC 205371]